jgi:hypothetical protein
MRATRCRRAASCTSSYTDDVISRHGMDGLRLVQKPFDAQTLVGALRSALDT